MMHPEFLGTGANKISSWSPRTTTDLQTNIFPRKYEQLIILFCSPPWKSQHLGTANHANELLSFLKDFDDNDGRREMTQFDILSMAGTTATF